MIAVRMSADELSTFPTLRPKRWEWLEAVSQRSNLTSSNSRHDRHGRDDRRSTSTHSPRPVFDIDGLFFRPKLQPSGSPTLQEQHLSFHGPFVETRARRRCHP